MSTRILFALLLACGLFDVASAGDVFDRHTSQWLKQAVSAGDPAEALSMRDAARLPGLSATLSSPCVVVRTNDGNYAKLLVAWGFRRSAGKPIPVLLLERFVTYRGDRGNVTTASGKDVMLFAGFAFNLDIGQVVPEGQGGDVRLTEDSRLVPVGDAEIYPLEGSLLPPDEDEGHDPQDHDGVLPLDFAGTWQINVDGRWKGELELEASQNGRITGRYTSAESQSSYPVNGRIAALPHRVKLTIDLENVQQTVDAYLWTTDKSAMAGTSTLAGRSFGFHAVRQRKDAETNGK